MLLCDLNYCSAIEVVVFIIFVAIYFTFSHYQEIRKTNAVTLKAHIVVYLYLQAVRLRRRRRRRRLRTITALRVKWWRND